MWPEHGIRGYTLLELATVVVILAVAASWVFPRFGGRLDRLAVRAARERVAGLLAVARARAPGFGGARVVVDESPAGVRVEALDTVLAELGSEDLGGVEIRIGGGRSRAVFQYDALGVGRLASGTLRFRRRDAEAALVVSSYGRVDRR